LIHLEKINIPSWDLGRDNAENAHIESGREEGLEGEKKKMGKGE